MRTTSSPRSVLRFPPIHADLCPLGCAFHRVCPELRQQGINMLFEEGTYTGPRDCFFHQGLSRKFGISSDMTAEAVDERVLEREAIQAEAST